jgi:UDPglucose 6-dehydrogenase
LTDDLLKVTSGATALVVLTEWPEFQPLDWGRLVELVERRIVVDTRNQLDADVLCRVGFEVRGVCRSAKRSHPAPSRALPELHADRASWD